MTIQQLIYFVTVSRTQTLNKAAQELFVSESSLSNSISKLEEECGFPLFQRSNKGMFLTNEGSAFYHQVQDLVRHYEAVQKGLAYIVKPETKIKIGFAPITVKSVLMPFLNFLKRQYPDYQSIVLEDGSDNLKLGLDRHLLDCIIVPTIELEMDKKKYRHKEVTVNIPLSFCCNVSHPLAQNKMVFAKDICSSSIIFWNNSGVLEKMITNEITKYGLSLNVLGYLGQISTIKEMIENNMGVSILPSNIVTDVADVVNIPFFISETEEKPITSNISIVWNEEQLGNALSRGFEDFYV